jgi:transcription initiation factor IIE alpha subunit
MPNKKVQRKVAKSGMKAGAKSGAPSRKQNIKKIAKTNKLKAKPKAEDVVAKGALKHNPVKALKPQKQPKMQATPSEKEGPMVPEIKAAKDINKLLSSDLTGYEMAKGKKLKNMNITRPETAKKAINMLLNNEQIIDYLKKNVSRVAPDVISMLSTPRTDEYIAIELNLKINAIRRILNILQGYGVTNYYVAKNTNGWLSFAWFINVEKLGPFLEYVNGVGANKSIINEDCNDYFICRKDYENDRLIFTFDSAFETGFKCSCGATLERISKREAETLMKSSAPTMEDNQDYTAASADSGE